MQVAVFSTKGFDRNFLARANQEGPHELTFFDPRLDATTAPLAEGFEAVCVFVNDRLDRPCLEQLAERGVRGIALRCAGFNNVDLEAAQALGLRVLRVPAYSPAAVAEHSLALMLALNRKIHRAYHRVRDGNMALDGLLGFDLGSRTVGIVGTGRIGEVFARLLKGFGCRRLAFDPYKNLRVEADGVEYVDLDTLYREADVISLHCPLTPESHHLIDEEAIAKMKRGVLLLNTSRGALIDTTALIAGLKSEQVGSVALDVYEEEADLFFEDLSDTIIRDDEFARLLTFPNVLITGHQAFFTEQALSEIAAVTFANLDALAARAPSPNEVLPQAHIQ
ncbi:MAG: 2-hydroxyacid dehydrogenase [Verrucomicrobiota bacterium]